MSMRDVRDKTQRLVNKLYERELSEPSQAGKREIKKMRREVEEILHEIDRLPAQLLRSLGKTGCDCVEAHEAHCREVL